MGRGWQGRRRLAVGDVVVVTVLTVAALVGGFTGSAGPLEVREAPLSVARRSVADEHPAWRLDRIAGHPLEVVMPRADELSDFERRALQAHVERTADRIAPYDWRAQGVRFEVRCLALAGQPCRIGVAIPEGDATRVVLSPSVAYLTDDALSAVIAHELAHAWQFRQLPVRRLGSALLRADVEHVEGVHLAELEADCLAAVWGHTAPAGSGLIYWTCPTSARIAVEAAWRAAPQR
jgi:hypothetical protein